MNELIEKLLAPISADQPAGPDLSYDPQQDELETVLKGTPEVEIGNVRKPAEPPDWADVKDKSLTLLGRSKSLRVAITFCCSLLQTQGLAGFRDGLQLLRGLLEQYWPTMYPLLDPDDNNDPTQRLNILSALNTPRGTGLMLGTWLNFIDYLYAAPLCRPRGAPPVTYEQLYAAKLKASGSEGVPADTPSLDTLSSILRACADQVQSSATLLQECLEEARAIDQFLTNTLSAGGTISFEELHKNLREMANSLQPYVASTGAAALEGATEAGGAGEEAGGGAAGGATIAISGSIRSREDVVRALERICDYYQQVEPSSPVPFLLRRAQKLAMMDFVQAVQELSLVADLSALRPSMGSALEGLTPPAPPAS